MKLACYDPRALPWAGIRDTFGVGAVHTLVSRALPWAGIRDAFGVGAVHTLVRCNRRDRLKACIIPAQGNALGS